MEIETEGLSQVLGPLSGTLEDEETVVRTVSSRFQSWGSCARTFGRSSGATVEAVPTVKELESLGGDDEVPRTCRKGSWGVVPFNLEWGS